MHIILRLRWTLTGGRCTRPHNRPRSPLTVALMVVSVIATNGLRLEAV